MDATPVEVRFRADEIAAIDRERGQDTRALIVRRIVRVALMLD